MCSEGQVHQLGIPLILEHTGLFNLRQTALLLCLGPAVLEPVLCSLGLTAVGPTVLGLVAGIAGGFRAEVNEDEGTHGDPG